MAIKRFDPRRAGLFVAVLLLAAGTAGAIELASAATSEAAPVSHHVVVHK